MIILISTYLWAQYFCDIFSWKTWNWNFTTLERRHCGMCRLIKSNDLSGCDISPYLRSALWHRPSLALLWGVPDNDRTPCLLHWFLIQAISNCNRCNNEADGLLFINCKIVKPFDLVWYMNSPAALKSIHRFCLLRKFGNLDSISMLE